ncbi:hypothetical protein LZ32DRAFT_371045 [Colletotrichum eremochloae]|nr:hypothetical protein LZ32DRAFT_371045 [Colletotrichum eremochloae]
MFLRITIPPFRPVFTRHFTCIPVYTLNLLSRELHVFPHSVTALLCAILCSVSHSFAYMYM